MMLRATVLLVFFIFLGCKPNPPSNSEVQSWFDSHFDELSELLQLGAANKALRRAEPSMKKYPTYYGEPSKEEIEAEKRVYAIVEKLKIDHVAYYRSGDNGEFSGMTVSYYSWGLSLGGYSKSIFFDPTNLSPNNSSHTYGTFIYLNRPGWFIDVADTR
jgi:hypothetical protein